MDSFKYDITILKYTHGKIPNLIQGHLRKERTHSRPIGGLISFSPPYINRRDCLPFEIPVGNGTLCCCILQLSRVPAIFHRTIVIVTEETGPRHPCRPGKKKTKNFSRFRRSSHSAHLDYVIQF